MTQGSINRVRLYGKLVFCEVAKAVMKIILTVVPNYNIY
jgi:hypothetical protein